MSEEQDDDVRTRVVKLDSALSRLFSMTQMSALELRTHLEQGQNLELLLQSLRDAKRESSVLKAKIFEATNKSNKMQQHLLDMKNRDMIHLQQKNAESVKELSNIKFQIAELKNSVSFQEAMNAQLTIENLRLKSALESNPGLLQEIREKSEEVNSCIREQRKNFEEQLRINTEQAQTIQRLNDKLTTVFQNDGRVVELEAENRRLAAELNEIQTLRSENEMKWKQDVRDMSNIASGLEEEIRSITSSPAHSSLQRKVDQLKDENDKLREELKKKQEDEQRTKERTQVKIERKALTDLKTHTNRRVLKLQGMLSNSFAQITTKLSDVDHVLAEITAKAVELRGKRKTSSSSRNASLLSSSLEFALRAMAKLTGASVLAAPSVDQVLADRNILTTYFETLKRELDEAQDLERSHVVAPTAATPQPRKSTALSATLSNMSRLMTVMGKQMQEEHSQLMSTLSDQSFSLMSSVTGD